MHAYLVASMHEYLMKLEVFIFSESPSTAFLWCASSKWPGETVQLPRLLWVIDVSITDLFVLLIGMYMYFKYMCFNLRRFLVRNQSILYMYTYNMYSKKNTKNL